MTLVLRNLSTLAPLVPPAWRNWQRTRLVIGRFAVRVRASALMFPQVRAIFVASGEIWIKPKFAGSH